MIIGGVTPQRDGVEIVSQCSGLGFEALSPCTATDGAFKVWFQFVDLNFRPVFLGMSSFRGRKTFISR